MGLYGYSNFGCPCFGRKFSTSHLPKHLVFSWLPNWSPLIEPRKSSSTFLAWKTYMMTSFLYVVVEITLPPSNSQLQSGVKVKMPPFVRTGGRLCYHVTFPCVVMLIGQAGRSTIPSLQPGNSATFRAARCLYFSPAPSLTGDDSPVLLRECRDTEKEFQERCKQFHLRPATPETLSTDIFGDWWEAYTHDFFDGSVDDIVTKVFGDHPQKIAAPPSKEKVQGIHLSLLLFSRRFLDPNSFHSQVVGY